MIHPNMISISTKEQNKIKFRSDLTSPKAWRAVLILKDTEVYYQDHLNLTYHKIDNLVDGNKLLLGRIIHNFA